MQWLKRTVVGSSKVDDSYKHGVPFENKKREYFQLESLLDKLNLAVKEYINLWGEVVRRKTEIYAMLLLFYTSASVPKRQLVDDVFQFHQKPLDGLVSTMARAYRRDLTGEIDKIMSVYPKTKERIEGLIHLRRKWKEKRNAVAAAVSTRGRRLFPERLNELDKEARMAKWMYDMEVSAVQREFENSLSQKASMLDRFIIRMLESDCSFFRGLFRSSEYFCATGRRFLRYREYPVGMPSRVGDPQPSEMDSSTDEDITDEDTTDDHKEDDDVDDIYAVFARSIVVVSTPRPSPEPKKSKKGGTSKGYYYYCRSRHPLELVLSNPRIPDFGTMHSLLDPRQQIDITDPRNSAVPNSIMTSTLARRFKQLARSEVVVPTKASLRPEVVSESVRIRKGRTRTWPLKPRPTTLTPMRKPKKK